MRVWNKGREGTHELVRNYITKGKILDVGCADGMFVKKLTDQGLDATGIDTFTDRPYQEQECKEKGIKFHKCGAEQMPFKDNTFDVVTAIDVFEHVEDLKASLSEIRRVTKKGGKIIAIIPNGWNWRVVFRFVKDSEEHVRRFYYEKALWAIKDYAGFEIEKIELLGNKLIPKRLKLAWLFVGRKE